MIMNRHSRRRARQPMIKVPKLGLSKLETRYYATIQTSPNLTHKQQKDLQLLLDEFDDVVTLK